MSASTSSSSTPQLNRSLPATERPEHLREIMCPTRELFNCYKLHGLMREEDYATFDSVVNSRTMMTLISLFTNLRGDVDDVVLRHVNAAVDDNTRGKIDMVKRVIGENNIGRVFRFSEGFLSWLHRLFGVEIYDKICERLRDILRTNVRSETAAHGCTEVLQDFLRNSPFMLTWIIMGIDKNPPPDRPLPAEQYQNLQTQIRNMMAQAENLRGMIDVPDLNQLPVEVQPQQLPPRPQPINWRTVTRVGALVTASTTMSIMQTFTPIIIPVTENIAEPVASYMIPMTAKMFIFWLRILPFINRFFDAVSFLAAGVAAYQWVRGPAPLEFPSEDASDVPDDASDVPDGTSDAPDIGDPPTDVIEYIDTLQIPEPQDETHPQGGIQQELRETVFPTTEIDENTPLPPNKIKSFKAALKKCKKMLLRKMTPKASSGGQQGGDPQSDNKFLRAFQSELAIYFADAMLDDAIDKMQMTDKTTLGDVALHMKYFIYKDEDFNNNFNYAESVAQLQKVFSEINPQGADSVSDYPPLGKSASQSTTSTTPAEQQQPYSSPVEGGGAPPAWMRQTIGALAALTAAVAFVPRV